MTRHAEYVNHMGDDNSVVDAARVSFDKLASNYSSEENEKLIKFLAKHDHWTPMAHTAITLRMNAPIPIRTQCFKHKVGLVENEESRRYISSTPEFYVPEFFRSSTTDKKQGSGERHPHSDQLISDYVEFTAQALGCYKQLLEVGVCEEQARLVLPQGCIVNWVWTGNLVSFANFYNKRTHPTAQKEVQDVANDVGAIISALYPISWAALTNTTP